LKINFKIFYSPVFNQDSKTPCFVLSATSKSIQQPGLPSETPTTEPALNLEQNIQSHGHVLTTISELNAKFTTLVQEMIAKEPPGKSMYDEWNWDPWIVSRMRTPNLEKLSQYIKEAWDNGESDHPVVSARHRSKDTRFVDWFYGRGAQ
jgi:hypothetical protein